MRSPKRQVYESEATQANLRRLQEELTKSSAAAIDLVNSQAAEALDGAKIPREQKEAIKARYAEAISAAEAASSEASKALLSAKGAAESKEAQAALEAAQRVLSAKGHSAAVANDPLGATGFSMNAGIAAALACGKYTRYPGVRWRPDSKKWRVQFSVKGKKVSLGSHATEEEAARVHDDYVRANGLSRPLHFPQEGEASSDVYRKQALARKSVAG